MAIDILRENVSIHQTLGDEPNTDNGLPADGLKAQFDRGAEIIRDYINETVVPAVNDAANKSEAAEAAAAEAKSIAESANQKAADALQKAGTAEGAAASAAQIASNASSYANSANDKAQQAMATASDAKQVADTALASAEGSTNRAYEALRIANDVAQEIKAYSPSGTRSIAEAAMRMASERLVAPPSASVGQYFRVAAVDANGVVTAVEAVDAPSGGVMSGEKNLILTLFRNAAYTTPNMADTLAQLEALWSGGEVDPDEPDAEKTLTSISATYSGGDVAVGTAVTALSGIVVTAHYSDGSTETVTGYTLSGTIVEGNNIVTVGYGGKTVTITVVGVASGEDEPTEPLYGVFWPPKGAVLDWNVPEWDDVDNFAYTGNTGSEYINAGLPGGAFVRLDKLQGTVYIRTLTQNQYGVMEQGCYEVYANSDGEIATGGFEKVPTTVYRQFGGKEKTMEVNGTTYCFMMFKFEIPAGQTGYFVSTANAMGSGYFVSSDLTGIDDEYKPYYTLFGSDPSDRITEPATEVE